jgi:hypothetical protein
MCIVFCPFSLRPVVTRIMERGDMGINTESIDCKLSEPAHRLDLSLREDRWHGLGMSLALQEHLEASSKEGVNSKIKKR